jgi:hypothetical protein
MVLRAMVLTRLPKGFGVGIEATKGTHEIGLRDPETAPPLAQGLGIGCFLRTKAAIAAPIVRWTERTTAGVRHRPQTWCALGHHDADHPASLAFDADAVWGRMRSTSV